MKLLIAIPALNEEASIATVIQRTLDTRADILARTAVTAVDITVVSDGSTDGTVERARAFGTAIDLIVFERNRGYGAAIMEAWRQSDAELVAFLDADGTCDPHFFVDLCAAVLDRHAHMVLGSRLHPLSRMPPMRRVGNVVFALMLTALGSTRVRDSASGMRVVRPRCSRSAGGWTARLAWQYQRFGAFEVWMIYHFVVIQLSTTAGVLLLTAGYLGRKAVGITLSSNTGRWRSRGPVGALLSHRAFWFLPIGLIALGALAIAPAATDRIMTGFIDPTTHHWSRFFAMSFAFSLAFILTSARLVDITLDLLADRVTFLKSGVAISSEPASAPPGRARR